MTVKEAAEYLNVHEETVRRWIREGKLHAKMASRRSGYRISEEEIRRFSKTSAAPALIDEEDNDSWMHSKELRLKPGKMEFRVEMDGIRITMAIESVELMEESVSVEPQD